MKTHRDQIRSGHRVSKFLVRLYSLVFMLSPVAAHALANCTVTASGVAFGSYAFINSAATDAAGNVQVSCSILGLFSLLVSYDIQLSPGGSSSYASRNMTSGANHLQYNLFTNAGHSSVWGDGTAGTSIVSDGYLLGLFTVVRNYPVYGRLPAGQNTPSGNYSDTITVTVTY